MFPFQPRRNPFTPDIYQDDEETPYSSMFKGEALPPKPQPSDADLYMGDINKIRSNPGPATSAYRNLLSSVPQSADYKPGKLTRIGAIASGVATGIRNPSEGFSTARDIIDTPYKTAMRDYSNKMSVTGKAADLEREDAQQQLMALSQARAMGLRYDEFKLKQLEAGNKAEHDRGQLKVNQDRAKAYVSKQEQKEYDYQPQADGTFLAVNKNDPTDKKIVQGNNVPAGTLKVRQREAATGEANAKSLESYRKVMGEAAGKRAQAAVDRNGKQATPYQQAKAMETALSILYTDPRFSKYVTKGSGTDVAPYMMNQDDKSPMYKEFRKQLKSQVEAAIKKGSPFGSSDSEEDSDDDIGDIEEQ